MVNPERDILNLIEVACLQLDAERNLIYINRKAAELFDLDPNESIGRNVWLYFEQSLCDHAFKAIEQVMVWKQPVVIEYFCRITEVWTSLNAIPAHGGVLLMFTEITEITLTRHQFLEEQRRLKLAQKLGHIGYFEGYLNSMELYASDELYRIYGLCPGQKRLNFAVLLGYVHPEDQQRIKIRIKNQIRNQEPFELVQRIINERKESRMISFKAEFLTDAFGQVNRICGVIQDVTDHHLAKEQLKESKDLLRIVFDTNLVGMALLKPVKTPAGKIKDFSFEMVSKEMEKESGRKDLPGKMFIKEYPGVKKAGLYKRMLKVMATGEPEQLEYYYAYDGFNKWYSSTFVKMEDSLVITNLDISKRKSAELEKSKSLALLHQSENLAKIGSWEYELARGTLTWSEGMYRLFELPFNQEVSPEIYLQYATAACRPQAEKIVDLLKNGENGFEEVIEVSIGALQKVLKIKASIYYDYKGNPLRVLGVSIDMSRQMELLRKNEELNQERRILELQQQREIFQTILTTQQDERRRIAENLHNGLGQLLYGVKLHLSKNILDRASMPLSEHLLKMRQTESLLADAIRESRKLSHQLMPAILEDFGLEAALNDIKERFQVGLDIQTFYTGLQYKMDKSIEIAVYRIVQELLMNVLKHAEATRVMLSVDASLMSVKIRVEDNGKGFDTGLRLGNGIGLKTISNKASLLNGSLEISSEIKKGTLVSITIPNRISA